MFETMLRALVFLRRMKIVCRRMRNRLPEIDFHFRRTILLCSIVCINEKVRYDDKNLYAPVLKGAARRDGGHGLCHFVHHQFCPFVERHDTVGHSGHLSDDKG